MSPRDALLAALALALSDEFSATNAPSLWEELVADVDPRLSAIEDLRAELQRLLFARFGQAEALRVLRKTLSGFVMIADGDSLTVIAEGGPTSSEPPPTEPRASEPPIAQRSPFSKLRSTRGIEHTEVVVFTNLATLEKMSERESSPGLEGTPRLRVLTGPQLGQALELWNPEAMVGRSGTCDLVLTDEGVSREHAKFVLTRDQVTVSDLGSTNWTFVNRKRVSEAGLEDGDFVRLASTILEFRSW